MFQDRRDAGQKLGEALGAYRGRDCIMLAIPRGGVEVGYYASRYLDIPLSLVVVRKLPFPENPEAGFGAIAEDDSTYFVSRALEMLPSDTVEQIIKEQKLEIRRLIKILRKGKSLPVIKNRNVILVDDGIAMGSTMQAAIRLCKNKEAKKIIVAAPVASRSKAEELAEITDETVILEKPPNFHAVAEVYSNWYDVSDDEVISIMQKSRHGRHK